MKDVSAINGNTQDTVTLAAQQTDLKGEGTFAEEPPNRNAFCQHTQKQDSTELEKAALDTLVSSSTWQYLWSYSEFLISYSLSGLQNKVPHKNKA